MTCPIREMQLADEFGFNVIGNVSASTGLGVHARHVIELLISKEHAVRVFDVNPGDGCHGHDHRFSDITAMNVADLIYGINLFVLPPASIFSFLAANHEFCFGTNRLNAAIAMWELPKIPEHWLDGFRALDVILAASDFVKGVYERHISQSFIVPAPCPLFLPNNVKINREAFGLPNAGPLFVSSFDPGSDHERKNPFAAIRAFIRAFENAGDARMVVKVNNPIRNGALHSSIQRLYEISRSHPNVLILDRVMSYPETLSLYSSCDVFVSLHRAEGLGLGLMEAMALGKPVIATAWSGNMSFMDHTNSCLVSYALVPVKSDLSVYKALNGMTQWAEPSEADAMAWMQELGHNEILRKQIGLAANEAMRKYQTNAQQGHFINELQAIREHRNFLPYKKIPSPASLWNAARRKTPSPVATFARAASRQWNNRIGWRLSKK